MKKIVFFLICLYIPFSYSQNKDLYILIDNESIVDIINTQNDSINLKLFRLKLNQNNLEYEFYIDDNGILGKRISVKSAKTEIIELIYKNIDGNNHSKLIDKSKIQNSITFHEMLNVKDIKSLFGIINSFENIYIINIENNCNGLFICERVFLNPKKSNL